MKRLLPTMFLALTLGSGAALASDHCNVPMSEWQPREMLRQKLQSEGWKVNRVRTDDGCYEVRAVDKEGRRVEAKYNPKTFERVEIERKR